MYRIGLGSDIHSFKVGRKLMLGGIHIDHEKGLFGHFDGDVILHSLCDALLGAAALGELEDHFPDDVANADRDSCTLLSEVCLKVWEKGYYVVNADIAVMSEEHLVTPYRDGMRSQISALLNIEKSQVNVKTTICRKLGTIGRAEGIFAQAVVLLQKRQT